MKLADLFLAELDREERDEPDLEAQGVGQWPREPLHTRPDYFDALRFA